MKTLELKQKHTPNTNALKVSVVKHVNIDTVTGHLDWTQNQQNKTIKDDQTTDSQTLPQASHDHTLQTQTSVQENERFIIRLRVSLRQTFKIETI